jgi:hypothetical protein
MDELQSKFKSKTMNEGEPERPGCVYQDNIESDLNEIDVKILTGFIWLRGGPLPCSCEHGNLPLDSIKGRGLG